MKEPNSKDHPLIVEMVGRGAAGKSFIYHHLKNELSHNKDYLFVETSRYTYLESFNIKIFLNSLFTILKCSLKSKVLIKYFKRLYLSQVLIYKYSNYKAIRYVIIDEGFFQKVRAIRRNSKKSLDKVRSYIFNPRVLMPDILIIVDADPKTISRRRKIRKGIKVENASRYSTRSRKINTNLQKTEEDILYAQKYKELKMININNTADSLEANIKYIVNELGKMAYLGSYRRGE